MRFRTQFTPPRFERQAFCAGLNLVVSASILWNTVYLLRVVEALRAGDEPRDGPLRQSLRGSGSTSIRPPSSMTGPRSQSRAELFRPLQTASDSFDHTLPSPLWDRAPVRPVTSLGHPGAIGISRD